MSPIPTCVGSVGAHRPAHEEIAADVLYQLDGLARSGGTQVRYVKPRGALYNEMATDLDLATIVVSAIASFDDALPLLVQPGSAAIQPAVLICRRPERDSPTARVLVRRSPGGTRQARRDVARRAGRR
jgi:UPF0271 protein